MKLPKGFCFQYPEAAHVCTKSTDTTILPPKRKKVKAGMKLRSNFDS
jgi:hypothetical protein